MNLLQKKEKKLLNNLPYMSAEIVEHKNEQLLYIPGHVPSFKNSKRIITSKNKLGKIKRSLIASKAWSNYEKNYRIFYKARTKGMFKHLFKGESYPLKVGFFFIRKTKQKFDFHNICAGVLDLMQHEEWIPEDDIEHIVPFPFIIDESWHFVDKKFQGLLIKKIIL